MKRAVLFLPLLAIILVGVIAMPASYRLTRQDDSEELGFPLRIVFEEQLCCIGPHPNKQDPMTISVVTDATYAANGEKIAAGLDVQVDASFDRGYIPIVIGGELNESFRYKPNLDDPNGWATVVLRGTRTFAKRNVLEKWNAAGNGMRFRVVAYELSDPDIKPKGVYYSFEIAEGSLIMSVRLDKQEAIPRDQVRILNDRVAYMFMGWKFAATADGGHT